MLLNLQPKTDKAYAEFERLGLMTYNTGKAMEFLSSRGIKVTGNSFEELDPAIRKYVEVISGAKIGTAKFDNAYREFTQQIGASQSVFYDNNGKLKSMSEISGILKEKLSGLNDAQRQMALNTMFGTDAIRAANILFNEGAEGANKMATEMSKITADETARIKMDNLKGAIEEMMGSLETAAIKIGEKAIPTIKGLAQTINSLSDKFLELSPWQQDAIIKFGLFAAAAGPVLMVIGSVGTGIGTLTTAFKGLSGVVAGLTAANGIAGVGTAAATAGTGIASAGGAATLATGGIAGFGASLGTAAIAAGPYLLAAAAVAGTGYAIYQGMTQEAIPAVDLFADKVETTAQSVQRGQMITASSIQSTTIKISEETKKAVQAYLDMDKNVTNSLMGMQMTNQKITQNIANDMTSKFNNMGKTITSELKKNYDNNIKVTQEFFKDNILLSSQEMANINSIIKNNYDQQVYEVEQANNKINQIMATAAKENRSITEEEMKEITAYKNTMKTNAIKALSEQEAESKVILDRMASYDRRVTAEMASEHVKQLNDARDKAVDAANKECNEIVAIAEEIKTRGGAKAKEYADKMIKEAERQRDHTIASANQIREKGINELSKSYDGLEKDIDTDTAQIRSHWDKAIDKVKEFFGLPSEKHFKVTTTVETKRILTDARDGRYDKAARGTRLAGHRGGPLITSEKGRELAILPSGQMFLTGNSGSEFWPHMPRGTHIIPNLETEKILRRKGVPGYAKGTGLKLSNNTPKIQGKMDFENASDELNEIKKVDRELYRITSRLLREFRNNIPQAISETNKAFDNTKENYKAKSDEEIKVLEEQLKEVERQEKIDKRNAELDKQALQNRKSEIKKVLDAEIKAINSQNNIKAEIKKQQIEELRKEREQEIAEIDKLLQNKKTINKYALEDEYTAKKESIRRQIEERKNQTDEEIKELERLEKAYLEKLQAEEEARNKFVSEINSLVSDLSTALKNKYSKMQQEAEVSLNKEIEALDNWQKESINRINSVYDAKIKAIDEASNAQIAAINAEIKALDEGRKQEDREETDKQELQNITNIKDSIEYEHDEYNKEQLKKQLEKAISDRNKRLKKLEIEDRKSALQEKANLIREDAEKRKQQLELQKQEELIKFNEMYAVEKANLNDRLTEVREFYAKKLEDANIQAEAEKLIIDNNQKEILNLLENYSDAYRQRGETLGQMLIDGFKPKLAELEAMIDAINAKITAARESEVEAMAAAESTVNNVENYSTTNNSTVYNTNVTASSNSDISRQVEYALKRVAF